MMTGINVTNRTDVTNEMIGKKLTSRELQVLTLTAAGFSDREIAEKLCVAMNTVQNHVLNIRYKLDAKNKAQAAVRALKKGLLSFEEIENYESGISNKE